MDGGKSWWSSLRDSSSSRKQHRPSTAASTTHNEDNAAMSVIKRERMLLLRELSGWVCVSACMCDEEEGIHNVFFFFLKSHPSISNGCCVALLVKSRLKKTKRQILSRTSGFVTRREAFCRNLPARPTTTTGLSLLSSSSSLLWHWLTVFSVQ